LQCMEKGIHVSSVVHRKGKAFDLREKAPVGELDRRLGRRREGSASSGGTRNVIGRRLGNSWTIKLVAPLDGCRVDGAKEMQLVSKMSTLVIAKERRTEEDARRRAWDARVKENRLVAGLVDPTLCSNAYIEVDDLKLGP
jgi:hypothetical protein